MGDQLVDNARPWALDFDSHEGEQRDAAQKSKSRAFDASPDDDVKTRRASRGYLTLRN